MLQALLRFFGIDPVTRHNAAIALCNRLTAFPGAPVPTPVVGTHAQCINPVTRHNAAIALCRVSGCSRPDPCGRDARTVHQPQRGRAPLHG